MGRIAKLSIAQISWYCVASTVLCHAAISVGSRPIEDRFANSDFVCVCRVSGVTQTNVGDLVNGKLAPANYDATIRVVENLKGMSDDHDVRVAFKGVDPLWGPPISLGTNYLLFLKAEGGLYIPSESEGAPAVQLPPDIAAFGERGGLNGLEVTLVQAMMAHANESEASDIVGVLLQFSRLSVPTQAALDKLSHGPGSRTVLLSLETLCRTSSESSKYVSRLIDLLIVYQSSASSESAAIGEQVSTIADILANNSTNSDIGGLEKLTDSSVRAFRLCAMLGIRRLRDPATIPFLIKALDSRDQQVQYEAVISLSEITGQTGDYGPGMGPFDSNPSKYIGLWKNWFQHRGDPVS